MHKTVQYLTFLMPCLSLRNVGRTTAEHGAARRGDVQVPMITRSAVLNAFPSFHGGGEAPLQ